MRVVWSPSSLQDISYIYNYVANHNPQAARDLANALFETGKSLEVFPYRGRSMGDNIRELLVVYPYIIRYEISGDDVLILRVRHGMRQQ